MVEHKPIKFGAEYPFPVIFWPCSSRTVFLRFLSFLFDSSTPCSLRVQPEKISFILAFFCLRYRSKKTRHVVTSQQLRFLNCCKVNCFAYTVLKKQRRVTVATTAWRDFYRAACNADAVLWGEFCPSVRLSVCLSHAWSLTKRKKDRLRFLYHTKDHLA